MGVPEMEAYWNDLAGRKLQGRLDKHDLKTVNTPAPDARSWFTASRQGNSMSRALRQHWVALHQARPHHRLGAGEKAAPVNRGGW